jgi:heptaprenyl diphosphate synthase
VTNVGILDDLALQPLAADLARVEQRLHDAVAAEDRFLGEVAGHLLGAGGKRLRPVVALCAAYAAKGAEPVHPDAVTGAACVELVHLGSLYHDDVIDEAETRRGVPSVNARWSNIVAILSGDYLLAQASVLAASLGAEVAGLIGATIGELCRGQVLELQHLFNPQRSVEIYRSSIAGKTASLLASSARVGGMVSGVDDGTLEALTEFGHHLGMCFQIVDDVLDLTAADDVLGKPAGNDLREGVYTLPVIYALEDQPDLAPMLGRKLEWDEVGEFRAGVGAAPIERATAEARRHARLAADALASADDLDPVVTDRLTALVDGLVNRSF